MGEQLAGLTIAGQTGKYTRAQKARDQHHGDGGGTSIGVEAEFPQVERVREAAVRESPLHAKGRKTSAKMKGSKSRHQSEAFFLYRCGRLEAWQICKFCLGTATEKLFLTANVTNRKPSTR